MLLLFQNLKLKAQEQIQAYHQKYKAYLDGLTEEEKAETIQQKLTTKKLRKMRKGKKVWGLQHDFKIK